MFSFFVFLYALHFFETALELCWSLFGTCGELFGSLWGIVFEQLGNFWELLENSSGMFLKHLGAFREQLGNFLRFCSDFFRHFSGIVSELINKHNEQVVIFLGGIIFSEIKHKRSL